MVFTWHRWHWFLKFLLDYPGQMRVTYHAGPIADLIPQFPSDNQIGYIIKPLIIYDFYY